MTFQSAPAGAAIRVLKPNGSAVFEGTTPATVSLNTRGGYFYPASYVVLAKLDGYRSRRTELTAEIDALILGNIVFGGAIGMFLVDPYSGAMWAFDRTHLIQLRRDSPRAPEPPGLPVARSDELPFAECFDSCERLVSNTESECIDLCGGGETIPAPRILMEHPD